MQCTLTACIVQCTHSSILITACTIHWNTQKKMESKMQVLANKFVEYFGYNGTIGRDNVSMFLSGMYMDRSFIHRLKDEGECPSYNFNSAEWYNRDGDVSNLVLAIWETAQTPSCHAVRNRSILTNTELVDHSGESPLQVWGFGLLSVTLINLCAGLGILFMPLMGRKIYRLIMIFMTSLAVGSLLGTALLILVPDSLQLPFIHEEVNSAHSALNRFHGQRAGWEQFLASRPWYIWRCCAVFGGVYLFFALERVLKELLGWKGPGGDHGHSHGEGHMNSMELEASAKQQPTPTGEEVEEEDETLRVRLARVRPVAWMILLGDTLHNFIDGLSMGAGFRKSTLTGASISLAVLCEELPHELGDFAILLSAGMSAPMAVAANLLSACACYAGFALGVLLGEMPGASVWIFAVGGGMFLYISLVDMMPEVNQAMDSAEARKIGKAKIFLVQNVGLFVGFGVILVIAIYGGDIKIG